MYRDEGIRARRGVWIGGVVDLIPLPGSGAGESSGELSGEEDAEEAGEGRRRSGTTPGRSWAADPAGGGDGGASRAAGVGETRLAAHGSTGEWAERAGRRGPAGDGGADLGPGAGPIWASRPGGEVGRGKATWRHRIGQGGGGGHVRRRKDLSGCARWK
nr:glycine-rich protein DOT1-like [Aegilops tauschii subsp. strangulata]